MEERNSKEIDYIINRGLDKRADIVKATTGMDVSKPEFDSFSFKIGTTKVAGYTFSEVLSHGKSLEYGNEIDSTNAWFGQLYGFNRTLTAADPATFFTLLDMARYPQDWNSIRINPRNLNGLIKKQFNQIYTIKDLIASNEPQIQYLKYLMFQPIMTSSEVNDPNAIKKIEAINELINHHQSSLLDNSQLLDFRKTGDDIFFAYKRKRINETIDTKYEALESIHAQRDSLLNQIYVLELKKVLKEEDSSQENIEIVNYLTHYKKLLFDEGLSVKEANQAILKVYQLTTAQEKPISFNQAFRQARFEANPSVDNWIAAHPIAFVASLLTVGIGFIITLPIALYQTYQQFNSNKLEKTIKDIPTTISKESGETTVHGSDDETNLFPSDQINEGNEENEKVFYHGVFLKGNQNNDLINGEDADKQEKKEQGSEQDKTM